MKQLILLFITLILCLLIVMCEKIQNNPSEANNLTFVNLKKGGCNNQELEYLKNSQINNIDTVIFSLPVDTLNIFIGINYLCCTPFNVETSIINDSIIINVYDTCDVTQNCYCWCMCYYTWDIQFMDFQKKTYLYKIVLHDPKIKSPVIIEEGNINILDLLNQKDQLLIDKLNKDYYYDSEIFNEEYDAFYGKWKIYGISGGIHGGGYPADFDFLYIKKYGIYSFVRNDTTLEYGKIVIEEQSTEGLKIIFDQDINSDKFIGDDEKYVVLYGSDTLSLDSPCCDRFNYHFNRLE